MRRLGKHFGVFRAHFISQLRFRVGLCIQEVALIGLHITIVGCVRMSESIVRKQTDLR